MKSWMKTCCLMFAAIAVVLASEPLFAQPGNSKIDAIKKQIEALQQQLNDVESSAASVSRNVTQIGSSRMRTGLRRGEVIVRIYDLGDLFAVAPTYAAMRNGDLSPMNSGLLFSSQLGGGSGRSMGGMGGFGGGGVFSTPATIQRSSMSAAPVTQFGGEGAQSSLPSASQADLIKTIKKTISPDMWDDQGGPSSIATLGNAFVISTDEDTHEQIDSLLNLFRKKWGTLRTVSVRAYWMWLDDDVLDGLLLAKPANPDDKHSWGLVDEKKWADLARRENAKRGYRAALTCYNGQTVNSVSGSERLAVTNIRPVLLKGDDDVPQGRVAYRPELSSLLDGAALQVTPIANVAGDVVLLDVHSRVGIVHKPVAVEAKKAAPAEAKQAADPGPAELIAAIDRPRVSINRVDTTLRIPIDRLMLVGGMSFDDGEKTSSNLYLFVKVAVQELRSDKLEKEMDQPPPPKAPVKAEPAGKAAPVGEVELPRK
ncbi:MAG: hypothetical protein O3A00_07980 [Planctomycetota bacterium]|nr:hypothetical protein [Planctomycetota bacterium]